MSHPLTRPLTRMQLNTVYPDAEVAERILAAGAGFVNAIHAMLDEVERYLGTVSESAAPAPLPPAGVAGVASTLRGHGRTSL